MKKGLHMVSFVLLVVGGLNWGLVGLFGLDLVAVILGDSTALSRIVYVLVGLSAIYLLATHKKNCRECSAGHEHKPAGQPGATA